MKNQTGNQAKKMKYLLLILLFITLGMKAESLISDTVSCDGFDVIVRVPESAYKYSSVFRYDEGFFKVYLMHLKPLVEVHYGGMTRPMVEYSESDSLIYKCKLGSEGESIAFVRDKRYFRRDYYNRFSIEVYYHDVPEKDLMLVNSILDNIRIIRKEKQN